MTDFWWGALAFAPPGFIAGIAFTLVAAPLLLKRRPMDGWQHDDMPLTADEINAAVEDWNKRWSEQ